MLRTRLCVTLGALVAALASVGAAQAHQTAVNNGVAVTAHVSPEDEPIVGATSLITITRVAPGKRGTFRWSTCRCSLKVSDSAGAILRKGPATSKTAFVFPEEGAYRIDFAGRVRRGGKWVWFKVWFALRAYAAESSTR